MMRDNQFSPISAIQSKYIHNKNAIDQRSTLTGISYRAPIISNTFTSNVTQLYAPNQSQKKVYKGLGQQYMQSNKQLIGFIIFAGGFSCRAQLDNNQCKEFYQLMFDKSGITGKSSNNNKYNNNNNMNVSESESKNMFEHTLSKINPKWNSVIYIICSRKNSEQVITYIQQKMDMDYPNISVYVCFQHQENVLDCNGLQSVYVSNSHQKLKYPAGIGVFGKAQMYYSDQEKYNLKEHIVQITKPKIVYCMGTCNYLQTGPDLQMIGLLTKQDLSCVFKCCPTKNFNPDLPQVCIRCESDSKPAWLVMEYNNLKKLVPKQSILKNYPVWMDNFVFNPRVLTKQYIPNKSQLQYQFNERTLKGKDKQLPCFIAEELISFAILRDKQKCVGYACSDGQFLKTRKDIQTYLEQSRIIMNSVSNIQIKSNAQQRNKMSIL